MAYMRGDYYIYSDGKNLYINSESFPMKTIDEYVVMRYAEMSEKQIKDIEKRVMEKHYGNFGADAVAKKHGKKTCLELIDDEIKRKQEKDKKGDKKK